MASNLACLGFAVSDEDGYFALLSRLLPLSAEIGEAAGVSVHRFQDASGARMVFGVDRSGQIVSTMPSFAAPAEVLLAGIRRPNEDAAIADLVDDDGEQYGQLAVELEERQLIAAPELGPVKAALVALGVDVAVFADAQAFAVSAASMLTPSEEPPEERPAGLPRDVSWPLRVSSSSFVSYGVWNKGDEVEAYARLAGEVLSAEERTVAVTGQRFIAARVRSLFPTTVCLPADEYEVPAPGAVIAGTVFMVGSAELPAVPAPEANAPAEAAQGRLSRFWRRR